MNDDQTHERTPNRRTFLKGTSAAIAAAPLLGELASRSYAAGDETIKIALVGCGLRGTGAVIQALSTEGPVKLWAMADAFSDRIEQCLADVTSGEKYQRTPTTGLAAKVDVPPERRFVGLDAYKKAIDSGADVVLIVTPPGFRPVQFEYAVERRRHVFMEKPIAVDAPGVRRIIAAAKRAQEYGLKVGVGLQRHHELRYQQTIQRLQDGAIGPMVTLWANWMGAAAAPSKSYDRSASTTEMEHQIRNWYYFTHLGGDHIVEQHIHNIDVANWVLAGHPVRANGVGGRQVRVDPSYGHIFDHFAIELEYENGARILSMCRQQDGTSRYVGERFAGTRGTASPSDENPWIRGSNEWQWTAQGEPVNPYVQEHVDLVASIRAGKPLNEGRQVAESTLSAILAREAAYTGRAITWDEILESDLDLTPATLAFGPMPMPPVAQPGVTKLSRPAFGHAREATTSGL